MIAVIPSLPNLSDLGHAQKDELIVALFAQGQALMAQQAVLVQRITELEGRLRLNSRNSSKPPSSDALSKPAPKSLRPSGERANGGQKGHSGNTLRQSARIDQTICHQAPTQCSVCQLQMRTHEVIETRQVFELPELRVRVIAHQRIRSTCTCGAACAGAWPPGVNAPAQYGASVKAMAVNLNQYHLVPLARTSALMEDLYGLNLSQASIQSFAQDAARALQETVAAIDQAVQAAPRRPRRRDRYPPQRPAALAALRRHSHAHLAGPAPQKGRCGLRSAGLTAGHHGHTHP